MASEDEVTRVPKTAEGSKADEEKSLEFPVKEYSVHSGQRSNDDADIEKHGAGRESNPLPDLKRKLKSRHLQMIAIGWSKLVMIGSVILTEEVARLL